MLSAEGGLRGEGGVVAEQDRQRLTHQTNYMVFIFGVTLLAFVNSLVVLSTALFKWNDLTSAALGVLKVLDVMLAVILLADFSARLLTAPNRSEYFFRRGGWLDLIGSFPSLAIFRLVRMYRTMRELGDKGRRVVIDEFRKARADGALLLIVWLVLVVLEVCGVAVLVAEHGASGAKILTTSDALWWGFQTITTVGYGDIYPVTNAGRLVGIVLMTVGVGLFGTFTAWLANWFFGPQRRAEKASEADS